MKQNEKKLLMLLGILFGLVLLVRGIPVVFEYYDEGQREIARLDDRVERYKKLIADTQQWQDRAALKQAEVAEYESWIFEGNDPKQVGTSVQRSLRQALDKTRLNFREMDVARFSYVDDWLVVSQDMDFTLEQNDILPFLNAIAQSRPRLHVTAFTITRNRRQFSGSITVVGFSRADSLMAQD